MALVLRLTAPLLLLAIACGDDHADKCVSGARICRDETVWACGPDGLFVAERTCHETNVCVDGECIPRFQPDVLDIVDASPDAEVTTPDTVPDTLVTADTTQPPDTTPADTTPAPDTTPADTTPADTVPPEDTTPPPDTTLADTAPPEDTTPPPDTAPADTTDTTDIGPAPEAPPGLLAYTKVGNIALVDDLIRVAWHPSGDFAFVLGVKGDVALYRPGENLVKVGKVGASPTDLAVIPTELDADLLVLDATQGLLRTRLTAAGDALEAPTVTALPFGSGRALTEAPAGSSRAGAFAIAAHGTDSIAYLSLWHPDTGFLQTKAFNAGAGIFDVMWAAPDLYAGSENLVTAHGKNGADSRSWVLDTDVVVANGWSPGFGNAGFAAWRPDPTRPSGLGLYGLVSGWSSNKLYVYDGAWQMGTLPVPSGASPQGIAWKWDGSRALIVGRVIGSPAYAVVIEHRPTTAAWGASFVDQSIPNFTTAPWSGNSSSQYLIHLAFRPNTACDEGLIVGADAGSSFSPTFGFAIAFRDTNDPACR